MVRDLLATPLDELVRAAGAVRDRTVLITFLQPGAEADDPDDPSSAMRRPLIAAVPYAAGLALML